MADARGALDLAAYGQGDALPCLSDATFSGAAAAMVSDAPSLALWVRELFGGHIIEAESSHPETRVA